MKMNQIDAVILENFYSMENGELYSLNDEWMTELRLIRAENGYENDFVFKFPFHRDGDSLFVGSEEMINFKQINKNLLLNLHFAFSFREGDENPDALNDDRAFTVILSLLNNGVEKISVNHVDNLAN
jgi:hypothetical protein